MAGISLCVREAHQRVLALREQSIRHRGLFFGAFAGWLRQGPGQHGRAFLAALRQLRFQVSVRGHHPQRLGAKQDEADQEGGEEKEPAESGHVFEGSLPARHGAPGGGLPGIRSTGHRTEKRPTKPG